jgi:hypothetical protein
MKSNNKQSKKEKVEKEKGGDKKLNNTEFNNLRFSGGAATTATPVASNNSKMKTIKEVNELDYVTSSSFKVNNKRPSFRTVSPTKQSGTTVNNSLNINKIPIMEEFIFNLPDDEEEIREVPKPMLNNSTNVSKDFKLNDLRNSKNFKANNSNSKNRYISDVLAEKLVDEILDYRKK